MREPNQPFRQIAAKDVAPAERDRLGFGGNQMFVIEDEQHAELQEGEFISIVDAISELKRRALLPWHQPPNVAPCKNWRTCRRTYEIVEYDTSTEPWKEIRRIPFLEMSSKGAQWLSQEAQ